VVNLDGFDNLAARGQITRRPAHILYRLDRDTAAAGGSARRPTRSARPAAARRDPGLALGRAVVALGGAAG